MDGIAKETREIYDYFQKIRGCHKEELGDLFWDVVVLTAGDEDQREAFELQLKSKLKKKEIPSGLPYHVFSDPPGAKAGPGVATMMVLSKLTEMYGDKLYDYKVLLINAGGQSQRLPSASVLGKIFTALPVGDSVFQVLDLKLACYLPFLKRMNPGVFHPAADTIEVFYLGQSEYWSFERPGFTALAHPSSLEIGATHGVFVLDTNGKMTNEAVRFISCLEVLQKPSIQEMREKNAVLESASDSLIQPEFVYTDSLFFFDHDITKKLTQFYDKEAPILCELNSYGDFMQALGPHASMDYIKNVSHVSKVEGNLVETREKIFKMLVGTPLNIIALNKSKFYHLGTTREYLEHFCADSALSDEVGFRQNVFNRFFETLDEERPTKKLKKEFTSEACLIHNYMPFSSSVKANSIIEFCHFQAPVHIGENCIVSSCQYESATNDTLVIPSGTFLHTVAMKFPVPSNNEEGNGKKLQNLIRYVTISVGTTENFKRKANSASDASKMTLFDGKLCLKQVIDDLRLTDITELFTSNRGTKCDGSYALWDAKLFPVSENMSVSFKRGVEMAVNAVHHQKYSFQGMGELFRASMRDILAAKYIPGMLDYRDGLFDIIQNHQ